MLCFPNCKINLGLNVTRRREDGYHDIETVFYPVGLKDVLEIAPAAETKMHVSGLAVSGNETDNLVWKAYELLRTNCPGKIRPLDIYLHKIIPMGAGLGGGSSDGAFMLLLLNDFFQLEFSKEQLAEFALHLGSDCPFFIYNTPKFARGRGEQMADVDIDLSPYSIQLICPEVHVSTGAAFGMIAPKPATYPLDRLTMLAVEDWQGNIGNDFEGPVFKLHPELAVIKQQLYAQGALYASMSGSGSAIYGIFLKGKRADVTVGVGFKEFYVE
jgi:4-diphosphocytidyl-2-C-methyl-D-erythritol kinase